MDVSLRNEVKALVSEHCEAFHLDPNQLFIPTFVASSGYQTRVSAVDAALACGTTLSAAVRPYPHPTCPTLNLSHIILPQ